MTGKLFLLSTALGLACPNASEAQSNGGETPPTGVDVIIVTGEKIKQNLQNTITSVGIISNKQLETDTIDSLADSLDYIANVNLNRVDEGFSIRGIPFDNLLGAGTSPLAQIYIDDVTIGDQATRFSADSVWDIAQVEVLRGAQSTVQGRNALAGAIIIRTADPTFEWEGKARTLYLESEYGNDYAASAAVSGPIVKDFLAFRIAAEQRESDGFVSNPVTGEEDADFNDQWLGRVKLLLTPGANISSLFTAAYAKADVASSLIDRRTTDANGFTNIDEIVPGLESNRRTFTNEPDFNRSTQWNFSLNTEWEAREDLTLTFISAYGVSEINEQLDTDNSNLDPAILPDGALIIDNPFDIQTIPERLDAFSPVGTQFEEQRIFTQEAIISYNSGGRLRGLAGAYYAKSDEKEYNFTAGIQTGLLDVIADAAGGAISSGVNLFLGSSGLSQPEIDLATEVVAQSLTGNYSDIGSFIALTSEPLDVENYAFYASGEYDITEKLTAGLGFRYDYEEQQAGIILSGYPVGLPSPSTATFIGYPDAAVAPQVDPVIALITQLAVVEVNGFFEESLAEADRKATQDFEAFLPSGFLRYAFDQDRSIAFSVRRGYRSGGSGFSIPRQFVSQFDPEYTTNYELAFRSFWLERSLRLNANIFYTDWTDQQVAVSLSTLQFDEIGFNVGQSTLKGFEIDTFWKLTDNWSVQSVLGYSDTEFENFDAALAATLIEAQGQLTPIDLEETLAAFQGRDFAFAPDWSGAMRVIYEGDSGLFGTLGLTYQGDSFVNNANSGSPTFLDNEERLLANATVGFEFENVTVALVARNLFDAEYVSSGGDENIRLGAPQEIGMRLQTNF